MVMAALVPFLVTVAAAAAVAATGLRQADLLGLPFLGDRVFGFYADHYAVFGFAAVYGVACLLVGPAGPSRSRAVGVLVAPLVGILFLLIASWPTFGGLILRPGHMAGMAMLLNGAPMDLAVVVGGAVAGAAFALVLGILLALVRLRFLAGVSIGRALASLLALMLGFAGVAIASRLDLGLGGSWPRGALQPEDLPTLVALLIVGLGPHVLVGCLGRPAPPPVQQAPPAA